MAVENEGGNIPRGELSMDPMGSRSTSSASGRGGLNVDREQLRSVSDAIRNIGAEARNAAREVSNLVRGLGGISGGGGRLFGGGTSRTNVPVAGTSGSPASVASGGVMSRFGGGPPGGGGGTPPGGGGGGGGLFSSALNVVKQQYQPLADLNNYMNQRIGQGAEYSLQADRMSVQLQQMYGMSNAQVRNQLRMPLTSHYLLGGGTAINDLLAMQANTGLTASKQASTVEAFRTVSGFSLGTQDVTRMLSTMAAPDTANRMFMMGGTGMYGIGGKERTGMQTIQDIVRRTGLTNPEALKGALQQGSNTRQRLTAMGVPQDMQDMVIQYAMQNSEYQKKTGGGAMYDPSMEENRRTMGIEGSYAVQHEKTTGERLKREERFYGRQVDNFADFERNLRTSTKMLAAFEDRLSSIIGLKISTKGHPITNAIGYGVQRGGAYMNAVAQLGDAAVGLVSPGGDPVDGLTTSPRYATGGDATTGDSETRLSDNNERKLATLDSRLAVPLRKLLSEKPEIQIGDARRSSAQQERSFKARYTRRPDLTEKTQDADRIWNGEVWVYDQHAQEGPPMAPPGQSLHEQGLAADLSQSHNEWIRANAQRFGLSHGGTQKGKNTDEPFHVQPAGVSGRTTGSSGKSGKSGKSSAPTTSSGAVKASSVRINSRPSRASQASAPAMATSSNAGAMAAQMTQKTNARYAEISNPYQSQFAGSMGGDPVDSVGMSRGASTGMSITVSPNIYLNGGQDMSGDMRRIAQEVGKLLEDEVKLRLMRRT